MKNLLLFVLLLSFSSCTEDAHPTFYTGCCDTAPILHTLNGGAIYIPNSFTPDFDGTNDLFYIHTSSSGEDRLFVEQFIISSPAGETLFRAYDFPPNNRIFGWDGYTYLSRNEYIGLFHYNVIITDEFGSTLTINSKACAIRCEEDITVDIDHPEDCTFGLQHNGEGGFDSALNNGETNCF